MALITSCPQCGTHFRITPLHLQAHGGEVRCGRCSHVFNAFSRLSTLQEPETSTLPKESAGEADGVKPVKPAWEVSAGEASTAPPSVSPQPEPPPLDPGATEQRRGESALEFSASGAAEEAPVEATTPETSSAADAANAIPEAFSDAAGKQDAGQGNPAREPHRAPPPDAQPAYAGSYAFESEHAGAGSFGWTLASLLLLIIFTGQTIFFYSSDLAAAAPAVKPYLQQYCELMGCSLSSSPQQQLLNIESSDMHSDPARPSLITLHATVRSYASSPQPFPLFELTFIDAQNRALASRIFRPDMYLAPDTRPESVPPGKEFDVRLHVDTNDLNPAGYRLSLFYPPSNTQS